MTDDEKTIAAVAAKLTGERFYVGQAVVVTMGGSKGRQGTVYRLNAQVDWAGIDVVLYGEDVAWTFPIDWIEAL